MSDPESQFILAAYRPDGSDAADPAMAEALEKLADNPEAHARFDDQVAFDNTVAEAVSQIPVPDTLRDEIVAGAKFSRGSLAPEEPAPTGRRRPRWTTTWLPLAATLVALGIAVAMLVVPPDVNADWRDRSLAAIEEIGSGSDKLTGADAENTHKWLNAHLGSNVVLPATLAGFPSKICEVVEDRNGKVYLVCFAPGDGTVLHLAIYEGFDQADTLRMIPPRDAEITTSHDTWEYAHWQDKSHHYLLAASNTSKECCAKLRQVLEQSNG